MSRNHLSNTILFKMYSNFFTWTLSHLAGLKLKGISLTLLTSVDRLVTARTCPDLGTLATGGRAL